MMRTLTLTLALAVALVSNAQITVTDSLPESELAELLEGLNVSILNVSVNCAGASFGHFSGTSEMPIEEGLILTTGYAVDVAGPASGFASMMPGTPGDADLEAAVGGMPTYDACVLEFDCIPMGDTLLFNFAFGSEEYPEFVGSAFNDVFAIFLSGPGMMGPVNVAALPDGTPVAINNVNAGMNSAYFIDNLNPEGQYVAYDGLTNNLVAFAEVEPDQVYHFKIAIADVADGVFDSGVFLEAFSFRSTGLTTSVDEAADPGMRLLRNGELLTVVMQDAPVGEVMTVTSASGQVMMQVPVNGDRIAIELSGLGSGLYILHVQAAPGIAPVRFVKN